MNTEKEKEEDLAGSDELRAYICSPCSKDGRTFLASSYCKDCDNVLCSVCLTQHNRFKAMASHEVVTLGDDVDSRQLVPNISNLPSLHCSQHRGKLLELYCGNHDEAICIICKTMSHSTCENTLYLPSVIEEIYKVEDITETISMIKDEKARLTQMKEDELAQKEEIVTKKIHMKTKIDDEKMLIKEHVDKLESTLLEEIETTTKSMMDSNMSRVRTFETTIRSLEKSKRALMARGNNLSDTFIQLKQIQRELKEADAFSKQQMVNSNFQYEPNNKLSKQLKSIDSLGTLIHGSKVSVPGTLASHKNVNILSEDDNLCPDISGACVLTDGHVVLVDCKNRSLKKLNERYDFLPDTTLKLSSTPWSACTVNSTTIAVSMWDSKSVLLIWVKGKMEVCSSFNISDRCSGICHNDEKLYVCVGGMEKGDRSAVEVYTLTGTKLNVFSHNICCPRSVLVLDETVFVADEEYVLVEIENGNTKVHACKDLVQTQSICLGSDGNLFICGMSSDKIFSFSIKEKVFTELSSEAFSIKTPQMLCFDVQKSNLLAGLLNCNFIRVYNFNGK